MTFFNILLMKILLLGATGLLGRNVLNILLDKGFDVVALVRKTHGISDIGSSHLSIVTGSLTDIESLRCRGLSGYHQLRRHYRHVAATL